MSSQTKSNYFICDSATGRVEVKVFGKVDDFPLPTGKEMVSAANHSIDDVYYDSGSKSLKAKGNLPEGRWVNGEFIIDLPIGARLNWQDQQYTIDDGCAEIAIDQPGAHFATVYHPHYYLKVYTIENPEAN